MRNTVGRWVAASLIKAVPGAGTVIGGAVSAAAAEQRQQEGPSQDGKRSGGKMGKSDERNPRSESLALDGFNTIITLEVALSGSLLLLGMDGTIRDLAGLRGTYRIVDKTEKAVRLLLSRLEALKVREAVFYLDQQVSNSGRLRGLLLELGVEYSTEIRAELHPCVDGLLSPMEGVVTSDAIILDKCGSWYNLNRDIVTRSIPDAWLFRPSFPNQ